MVYLVKLMRWRKSDLLAVLGLLLVLVWTPQYVAQSDAEAELTWEDGFRMLYPRDGMVAELELVSQWKDGPVLSHGTIITVSYEAVDPETAPMGAVWRERIVLHPGEHDLGFATYSSRGSAGEPLETARYFDAGGRFVWEEYRSASTFDAHDGAPYVSRSSFASVADDCQMWSSVADHAGTWKRFETSITGITLADLSLGVGEGILKEPACFRDGGGGFLNVVNIAADHEGERLYGRHHVRADRLFDKMSAAADGDSTYRTCPLVAGTAVFPDREYGDPYFGRDEGYSLGLEDGYRPTRLVYAGNMTVSCDIERHFEKWDWISPRFPIPVGHHARYWDPQGDHLFTVDVVPKRIVDGSGPALPVDVRPEAQAHDRWHDAFMASVTEAQEDALPFARLKEDRTVLAHSLSIAAVHGFVTDPDSPRELRDFATSSTLIGIKVTARAPAPIDGDTSGNGTADTLLPELDPPSQSQGDTERRTAYWTFLYSRADGAVRVASVTVNETRPSGAREVVVVDLCAVDPGPRGPVHTIDDPWACAPLSDLEVLSRSVVPPFILVARADAAAPDGMGTLAAPKYGGTRLILDPLDTIVRGYENDESWEGAATWSFDHRDGPDRTVRSETASLWSGAVVWSGSTRSELYEGNPPTPLQANEVQGVRHLDVTPSTLATSGLLLVALSALIRIMAAMKSGAHYGIIGVLYAKIAKDKVLVHERRQEIQDALRSEPGLTVTELSRRLGYGWGATVHHLETLKRNGMLTTVVHGRARRYFLAGEASPLDLRRMAVAKKQEYASFLDLVAASPGLTLNELTERLPQGRSGASRTGARLSRMGLVRKERDGKAVRFFPLEEDQVASPSSR